jgi:hypothetical protein
VSDKLFEPTLDPSYKLAVSMTDHGSYKRGNKRKRYALTSKLAKTKISYSKQNLEIHQIVSFAGISCFL